MILSSTVNCKYQDKGCKTQFVLLDERAALDKEEHERILW